MALFRKKKKPVEEKTIWETMQAQAEAFKARDAQLRDLERAIESREKDLVARGGTLLPYEKTAIPQWAQLGKNASIEEVMNRQSESMKIRLQNLKNREDALEMAERNLRKGHSEPVKPVVKEEPVIRKEPEARGVSPVMVNEDGE